MIRKDIKLYTAITKVDDEQRMVWGYCTSEALDSQGEIIKRSAIRKAWDDYMKFGNVREMHQPSAVGVTQEYEHDDKGTMIGVKVVDDRAWKFVKEGVYKGFSIGGRVVTKVKNIITEIVLFEISLVDRPACPDAVFNAIKVDSNLVDAIHNEKIIINKQITMKKFVEIDGQKFVEDEAKPGEALLDAQGNPVPFVEETETTDTDDEATETDEEKAEAEAQAKAEADAAAAAAAAENGGEPAKPADVTPPVEATPTDKGAKPTVTKDSTGVLCLAGVLDHLVYLREVFSMNKKDVSGLDGLVTEVKSMIATEAGESDTKESGIQPEGLAKIESQLSKAMQPVVDGLAKFGEQLKEVLGQVDGLNKEVAEIKGSKKSPRPTATMAVDKGFVEKDANAGTFETKRTELVAKKKEIDDYAVKMAGILQSDPSQAHVCSQKAAELYAEFTAIQRDIEGISR